MFLDGNGYFGRALTETERRLLLGCKLPPPCRFDNYAVPLGNKSEIALSLPASQMSGNDRHRSRRLDVRFVRRDREKMPKDVNVVLNRRPDCWIGQFVALKTLVSIAGPCDANLRAFPLRS